MTKHLKWLSPLLALLALMAVAYGLLHYESEYLWKAQELNLFLDTPLFLRQQMVASGWLLTWLGTYLTEFFFHPWLGVTILCGLWALTMLVIGRTFRVSASWSVVLLVPVALLLLTDVDLGYWIYYLKLRGHFFAATLGTLIAVGGVWLFRAIAGSLRAGTNRGWIPSIYIIMCAAVLYPLIGFYGLLSALLCGVLSWRLEGLKLSWRIVITAVAVLSVVVVPLVYYRYVFCETNIVNIYWTGLPLFIYGEETPAYYIPYYLLVAFLVLLAALYRVQFLMIPRKSEGNGGFAIADATRRVSTVKGNGGSANADATRRVSTMKGNGGSAIADATRRVPTVKGKGGKLVSHPMAWCAGHVALIAVLGWGVCHFWYDDYNFHKELRMQQRMEECDWEGMLREAADQQDEPTRAIVMMRNLALFRLGRQGDEMYRYPAGAKASDTPLPLNMTQVVGRSIYYNYGQLNFCYRWCLEDGVEMGWRVEYLKYLVRCAMLNGEDRVVRKYTALLRHTRYYRDWAEKYEALLKNPDTEQTLRRDKDFGPVFHMLNYDDYLASDNAMVEYFLMNKFANTFSADTLFQEQSLLSALWTKDIQTFWPHFFNYARLHPNEHMPRHYQEAAYLYGHLEHEVDVSNMPFDQQVVQDYNDFMAMAQQYSGMSEEQLKKIMYPRFGKTFYFEYFLIRNQKLY